MKCWIILLFAVTLIHRHHCVEVHFEAADSGFFLKHSRQPPSAPEISNIQSSPIPPIKARTSYDSVLSVDRFTVVQTTQPVSIRASYGPFSTKQTVPARYIVPDAMEIQGDYMNNTTAALIELQQSNMHLDISAHLVRNTVPQDSPVLRVLFHAGADPGGHLQRQKICVLLHVSMGAHTPLKGRCMPEGEDGVCLAEVVIPSNWWPPIPPPQNESQSGSRQKVPQRFAQLSYSVFEPPIRNPEQCEPKVQIQPLTTFAQVPLISATTGFKEIRADESLTILLPQHPLYPMSKIHVPVFLHQNDEQKIAAFTVRARVKSGIKILGATASADSWNISIEKENQKHTTARVTAYNKEQNGSVDNKNTSDSNSNTNSIFEVFSWLLEVSDDSKEIFDGGKIVWSVTYVYDNSKMKDTSSENVATEETKRRLIAKLEINKDDIQAVLPMAKNWELMNTAVLTGRQVAQAMKVFIVSQAGKVADVTLQSSCHAEDESVIKVSSSCSSVYVDGSEIRGSSNASVIVKYGTYIGVAKFIVWMPEFPLEVYISDFRLSQIKGWKVLDENHYLHSKQSQRRKKRSYVWAQHNNAGFYNNVGPDKVICRARYQQSPVEVYARFLAIDQNSGRISYFISRRTGLRVTDLVQPLLRIADPKIASLKGRILQGKSMGRTDVQVLSPITGRVIGAKEIRVGSDKVSLSKLIVRVVSGLQLTISPDNTIENGYIAETSVTHKLTAQYQEGLLDIDLEFSDGSRTPLRDISVEDYFLLVESLDTEVVAFAPILASHNPRVIAVGEGNGNLLRITLLLSENCRMRRNALSSKAVKSIAAPLASALASVEVDFNNADGVTKHDSVQNDGIVRRDRTAYRNTGDLSDITVGIPLRDSRHNFDSTSQAKHHRSGLHSVDKMRAAKRGIHGDMTSIELGMYVLLMAFCFAIIVFVISCVVYASKFRLVTVETGLDATQTAKGNFNTSVLLREPRLQKESTTNAHDWVWLGRSTMDRSSITNNDKAKTNIGLPHDAQIRITSNPIVNYAHCNNPVRSTSSFNRNNHLSRVNPMTHQRNEIITCDNANKPNENAVDYRPPVPPHRNIGVRATFVNNGNKTNGILPNQEHGNMPAFRVDYQGHNRNRSNASSNFDDNQIMKCENKLHCANGEQQHQMISPFPQTQIKSKQRVNQSSPEQIFSPQEINDCGEIECKKNTTREMQNAERLINESMNHHQKYPFQLDALTPKRMPPTTVNVGIIAAPAAAAVENDNDVQKRSRNNDAATKTNTNTNVSEASSDDSGGFNKPYSEPLNLRRSRVKRATVVGNPMFSTNADDEIGPGESLGLDDLDMDYEQIMHYFENLKESNA